MANMHAGTKRKERDFDQNEEETNINVVVRCRGRNEREVRENSGVVLSTEGVKGNSLQLSMGPNALSNKTYQFDRVFSAAADQGMVYDDVVTPILEQVSKSQYMLDYADDVCRCFRDTIARYLRTVKLAPAKHTQCLAI